MKICDRTWNRTGKPVPANVKVIIGVEEFDLCLSEAEKLREFINEPVKVSTLQRVKATARETLGLKGKQKAP